MSIDQLRSYFREQSGLAGAWFDRLGAYVDRDPAHAQHVDKSRLAEIRAMLSRARSGAESSLLNVAFLGEFSSGKSFLISGLYGRLSATEDTSGRRTTFSYEGLLPSGPEAVSACPVRVVSVPEPGEDQGGRGRHQRRESRDKPAPRLRVRFAGETEWTDIGPVQSLDQVDSYVTVGSEHLHLREHRDRPVSEAEVAVQGAPFPAVLWDLPGHSSPVPDHADIINRELAEADCYVYVTRAVRALGQADADMIRRLFREHSAHRRKVIWVLTAIDEGEAPDRRSGLLNWQKIQQVNNEYLREKFGGAGKLGESFIGDGFIPVSPAWEAEAELRPPRESLSLRLDSRMNGLRGALNAMIESATGASYLKDYADDLSDAMFEALRGLEGAAHARKQSDAERGHRLRAVDTELELLETGTESLLRSLQSAGSATVRSLVSQNLTGQLANRLHARLDKRIAGADLLKPDAFDRLETEQAGVIADWLEEPDGPAERWDRSYSELTDIVNKAMGDLVTRMSATDSRRIKIPSAWIDVQELARKADREQPATERPPLLERAAGILKNLPGVGAATAVIATGAAQAAAAVGLPAAAVAVLTPVGAGLVLASAGYVAWRATKGRLALREKRDDFKRTLDKTAAEVIQGFELQMNSQVQELVSGVDLFRIRLRTDLHGERRTVSRALETGEVVSESESRELTSMLEDGQRIRSALQQIVAECDAVIR
ncbi:hypothetical protein JIG36_00585 [Actinoplanes sp. LDG1-06]|uniref:Dynamin family protein n=1 Tax=Paractinoplanes ovalisporus TaxID=2810368 RepID=A0ABS2A2J9_9ACTN|nr:hypothetical protein [Actinoplanes ovalisporus]MBM2614050.1 hypothetical protein [Actinoplanes ovalisporus]